MNSENKILITGAAGFIGSGLAAKLARENTIVTIDNTSTGYESNLPKDVIFYKGDCADKNLIEQIFEEHSFSSILHIAGQSSGDISFDSPEYDLSTNTLSTLLLLDQCKKREIKKFIYASTMSVYGDSDKPCSEESVCYPKSFYGVGKLASEKYLDIYRQEYGIDTIAIRLFNVYGPGQNLSNLRQGMVSIFLAQLMESNSIEIHGSMDRFRDFIYIDDVLSIILKLHDMDHFPTNIINLGTGTSFTVKDLLSMLQEKLGHASLDINQPKLTQGDIFGMKADASRLKAIFPDYEFTQFSEGLDKTIAFYK